MERTPSYWQGWRRRVKIDIGGGQAPRPGMENLDPVHGHGKWRRTLQDGIPVKDGEVEMVRASHVLEHIETRHRIACFNEVWRVLEPGGIFEIYVPLFPTWQAIADPTHVAYFVKESFHYFTGEWTAAADYGIKLWQWADEGWRVRDGWEARARLRKPIGSPLAALEEHLRGL